ncbi:M23 family metallopeptidase [Vallitalea guaymasensis]|uniref:M23 family metallopeptidase n=1 Tax=Vallitalea guaymasensis TaxID=1185412 RepID=UPI00235699BE|nr:M23 family metallopeptidase [Vallitalea guaymasensis]
MKKIIITVIIFIICCPISIYAENASALLDLYGIEKLVSVETEEKLLQDITKEYYSVQTEINKDEMVEKAIDIYSTNYENILSKYDSEINTLKQQLIELKTTIYENRNNTVEYLLELDSEYKSIQLHIQDLLKERKIQVQQLELLSFDNKNAQEMEKKSKQLKSKLNSQKKAYEKAITYPELGDVNNLNYPLNKSSHVTSGFGTRTDPIEKDKIQFHNGIDLSAALKTEVTALFNGTVEKAGHSDALGYYVILNHGKGIRTIYGHLNHYIVSQGQQVNQYEVIASSGNSGSRSTGPHLHLGLYINGEAVDPSKVFK